MLALRTLAGLELLERLRDRCGLVGRQVGPVVPRDNKQRVRIPFELSVPFERIHRRPSIAQGHDTRNDSVLCDAKFFARVWAVALPLSRGSAEQPGWMSRGGRRPKQSGVN